MAVIKIKVSMQKKDEKVKNARDIIETLDLVYANEKLLITFKDKFQDWSYKVIREWRLCCTERYEEFQNSNVFRVLSTTILSLCFLEFFKGCFAEAADTSYITLSVIYYLLFVVMDFTSVMLIAYLSTRSIFYEIYDYFKMIKSNHILLSHRMSYVQKKMNLDLNRGNSFLPDLDIFEEKSKAKKISDLLFSFFSLYGLYLAFFIFILFSYFHYESLIVLWYSTFYLITLVGISKVFAILKFLRITMRRRKYAQEISEVFETWFDNECELKHILQESSVNTKIRSAFSHQSYKTFPSDEYLNFLIFAITCEEIFHSNLNDQDIEKAVLVLLYGQLGVLKDDSQINDLTEITSSCNIYNEHTKNRKLFSDARCDSSITANDGKTPETETKTNETFKSADSKDTNENNTGENTNLAARTFQNKKSKIPRYVHFEQSIPVLPITSSNSSIKDTFQPSFHNANLDDQNDLSTRQNVDLATHPDSRCDEETAESDLNRDSVTQIFPLSTTVTKVIVQSPCYDENVGDENNLSTEANSDHSLHSNSRCDEETAESDLNGTSVARIFLLSNSITKDTVQPPCNDENVGDPNSLTTVSSADLSIHSNSYCEEENTEANLKLISEIEETDSTITLPLDADPSEICCKIDNKTEFINHMDSNTEKLKECNINDENVDPYYNRSEIITTAQNSDFKSGECERCITSVPDSVADMANGIKTCSGTLDKISGDKIEQVTNSLLLNKNNVINGYSDDMDFNINDLCNSDTEEVNCLTKCNGNNERNLKGLEEIETAFKSEIPSQTLEVKIDNESKLVSSPNERVLICNSLGHTENKGDNIKSPETRQEKISSVNNFLQMTEELCTVVGISSSAVNEILKDLLECTSKQDIYLYLKQYLTPNLLNDIEYTTFDNFISVFKGDILNKVVEPTLDTKNTEISLFHSKSSNLKNVDVDELSEVFSKINIQPGDIPSTESKNNVSHLNLMENLHSGKIKSVFQIDNILQESNKITLLDEKFTSSSPKTEERSEPKSSDEQIRDIGQEINQNCPEQNTSNNDAGEQGDDGAACETENTFLPCNVKEISKNSSSSETLKLGEKPTCNKNEESDENSPHLESTNIHMRNESKPDETIFVASCSKTEMSGLEETLYEPKFRENLTILAKDAPNFNESDIKLPTDNSLYTANLQDTRDETSGSPSLSSPFSNKLDKTQDYFSNFNNYTVSTYTKEEISDQIKNKTEETESTSKTWDYKLPGDITDGKCFSNPTVTQARPRLKGRRSTAKLQRRKKETDVNLGKWQNSKENVNRTEVPNLNTESSKVNVSVQKISSSRSCENCMQENETTNECVPSAEINISQVQNGTPYEDLTLSYVANASNINAESMESETQRENTKVVLGTSTLDGNEHEKLLTGISPVSILNSYSVLQNEADENVSNSKSSQDDSIANRESKQLNGYLISSIELGNQTSIPADINNTQQNPSKEITCVQESIENNEKDESNQIIQDKVETTYNSSGREHTQSSTDISPVKNINMDCDETMSSSDLNRLTYISLNEKKILVADSSPMSKEMEDSNRLENSSTLEGTPHSNKEMLQSTMYDKDEVWLKGSKINFCNGTSFSAENSQNCNERTTYLYLSRKGQMKIRHTEDSAAQKDKACKQNVNPDEHCDKKRNTEVTRKKDKRYVCLQKFRGIVIEEDTNTEICEFEQYERQTSHMNSCEKLSVAKETTSVKMSGQKNDDFENAVKISSNQSLENLSLAQESVNKNQETEKWMKSLPYPEKSSTVSERPPTGSSECEHFLFHPSTSVSNSNASMKMKIYSGISEDSQVFTSHLEEEQLDEDEENFYSGYQKQNMSNILNGKENVGIQWKNNLSFNNSEEGFGEHRTLTSGKSTSNEYSNLDRKSFPLKYHIKCDNLDVSILDPHSHLTVRFVKECENEYNPVSKNNKLIETLTHSGSSDEIFLPTDVSSLHSGRVSSTHPLDLPEISNFGNIQMSAEKLPTGFIGNIYPQNTSPTKSASSGNLLAGSNNNQGNSESTALKTRNDEKSCPKTKSDEKVCALDPGLKNCEKSSNFLFESEEMKIDYNPYSNSESILISYRRHKNNSKLTFKSQKKKLYLKTMNTEIEEE